MLLVTAGRKDLSRKPIIFFNDIQEAASAKNDTAKMFPGILKPQIHHNGHRAITELNKL